MVILKFHRLANTHKQGSINLFEDCDNTDDVHHKDCMTKKVISPQLYMEPDRSLQSYLSTVQSEINSNYNSDKNYQVMFQFAH